MVYALRWRLANLHMNFDIKQYPRIPQCRLSCCAQCVYASHKDIYEVVRTFLILLEGLFRSLKAPVARTQHGLLTAIRESLAEHGSTNDAIESFKDNAIFNKGNSLLKGGGKGKGKQVIHHKGGEKGDADVIGIEPDQPEVTFNLWHIYTAQAIAKVSSQLQTELLGSKVMSYFAEWCRTSHVKAKGVAFADCITLYDVDAAPVKFEQSRSPNHNIYIGINVPLLLRCDPVLRAAMERVGRAYEQTFWAVPRAFQFGQACQALAKRGLNVNQLTVYWGPGGVGLSLFSEHLHAMYGPSNHKFFDPNIFYVDEELRKQVESLAGACIYTGQEKPTGGKGRIREDLIKKFATGEGISGRMPYAILTKLIKIIGWKRMEVNKLIRFEDVVEENFESIMRLVKTQDCYCFENLSRLQCRQ